MQNTFTSNQTPSQLILAIAKEENKQKATSVGNFWFALLIIIAGLFALLMQ